MWQLVCILDAVALICAAVLLVMTAIVLSARKAFLAKVHTKEEIDAENKAINNSAQTLFLYSCVCYIIQILIPNMRGGRLTMPYLHQVAQGFDILFFVLMIIACSIVLVLICPREEALKQLETKEERDKESKEINNIITWSIIWALIFGIIKIFIPNF